MTSPTALCLGSLLLAGAASALRLTLSGPPAKSCPSVYVYDLPEKMNDLNASKSPWGGQVAEGFFNTSQYALAQVVLDRVARSERCKQVTDPKKADMFIVPILAGTKNGRAWEGACENHSVSHEEFLSALPHMTPENVHKHVVFVGKGHPKADQPGCASWWAKPQGLTQHMWRVSYSDLWDGPGEYGQEQNGLVRFETMPSSFIQMEQKGFENLRSVPYVSSVHWSKEYASTPPWKTVQDRKLLMAFFGTEKTKTEYSKEIRPFLFKACESFDESCQIFMGGHLEMFKQKQQTRFCLEPAGDSPYRKSIAESLLAGCIPVTFSQQTDAAMPWHWDDWKEDSRVYIPAEDLYSGKTNLREHLASIPEARVKLMQKTIAENAHKMQYALDDVPGDAVEVILRHVAGWEK